MLAKPTGGGEPAGLSFFVLRNDMQTPKRFSSFSDQVSWISDEKGIKIKDREYAEEMLRQIGYFPLMGGYKHLFRISNTKNIKQEQVLKK